MIGRKPRPLEELLRDSAFTYQVGRLAGAAELVAHWLILKEDANDKAMGAKLAEVVGFFYQDSPK